MKTVSIIGIGKLGICFGLNLERSGYNVLGVDINEDYVNSINNKSLISSEPEVTELLKKSSENIKATTDIKDAVKHSDTLFVLVATPSLENGKYDHSSVDSVVKQLKELGKQDTKKHLIIGCTVMPGYCDSIKDELYELNYILGYNPEFIAQGSIIRDQLYPDMVLIGEEETSTGDILETLYKNLCKVKELKFNRMSLVSAELTKISLNCFITAKISFANMIGDIAKLSGAEYEKVLYAIGDDSRVGHKCLRYGYGFGGPCFPRDNRALYIHSDEIGYDAKISKVVDMANEEHLKYQIEEFVETSSKDEKITFDGVAYKKDAVIITESQKLLLAVNVAKMGYNVHIIDNKYVIDQLKNEYGDLFTYEEK